MPRPAGKNITLSLDPASRRALRFLRSLPGSFNISAWVRQQLLALAKERGMDQGEGKNG